MTEHTLADLSVGDRTSATITQLLPFGAFVATAHGIVGLVTSVPQASVGDDVTITIDAVDAGNNRFSATAH